MNIIRSIVYAIVTVLVLLTCGGLLMGFIFIDEPVYKKVVLLVPVAILVTLLSVLFVKDKIKFISWFIKLLIPKNTNPDIKEISGCVADEPNLSNPNRPWCSICTVHSDFNVKITYAGAREDIKKELYYCRDCKNEMHIPSVAKFAGKSLGQFWLRICLFICLPVGLFGIGVDSLKNELSFDAAGLLLIFLVVGGGYCVMLMLMRNYSNFYRKWKKWTNENGY